MASLNPELSPSEDYWIWLPKDLWCLILNKLFLVDLIRIGAVCKQWRALLLDHKKNLNQWPMLLVPTKSGDQQYCKLYNVFYHTMYDCRLPLPYTQRCCGSSHGWLVRAEQDLSITLINPFSGKTISLPPVTEVYSGYRDGEAIFVPDFHIRKVILSDDPSQNPNNYVVVTIYSDIPRVAFIRSGDQSWTYVGEKKPIKDIYFYKGQLYALDGYNSLLKINTDNNIISSSSSSDSRYEIVVPRCLNFCHKPYLVESSNGDLLMVQRHHWKRKGSVHLDVTVGFKVYKLMMHPSGEEGETEWVRIDGLGDDALFLGDNHTIRIVASDIPNCQPDSIYYTDDYCDRFHHLPYEARDMGVFNFKGGSIERHYILDASHQYMPPAVWIMHKLM
ncbi:putative F-box protein At3g25750 [Cornus florida]|uniref:putative F-box protein At3g25750 n=1 Tax=Cornus florida TaxID=4283 RepID=UPI00289C9BD9|nr:putative F-box protein At3g25750 [Cornus florida]